MKRMTTLFLAIVMIFTMTCPVFAADGGTAAVSATQAGANAILKEFGLELKRSKIINGHMPVKIRKGESPVKAGGKLLVIDGGLSRAYQPVTGIAGYTLTFNSREMSLAEHHPFDSVQRVVNNDEDMHSSTLVVEKMENRLMIRDTDNGQRLARNINDLEMLLDAYRAGMIKQK